MGASLLIFLNKTDIDGCMTIEEAETVRYWRHSSCWSGITPGTVPRPFLDQDAHVEDFILQCNNRSQP